MNKPQPYKFIKYQSIYDADMFFYALERDAMKKVVDGIELIEVTTNFQTANFVRTDSLKPVGSIIKHY